jgi:hypothetical protein
MAKGWGDIDWAALARVVEENAGVELGARS